MPARRVPPLNYNRRLMTHTRAGTLIELTYHAESPLAEAPALERALTKLVARPDRDNLDLGNLVVQWVRQTGLIHTLAAQTAHAQAWLEKWRTGPIIVADGVETWDGLAKTLGGLPVVVSDQVPPLKEGDIVLDKPGKPFQEAAPVEKPKRGRPRKQ